MPPRPTQDRQKTLEQGSDSGDDGFENEQGTGTKTKKKGNNAPATRRDKNRIAQQEFRLRKQQRIQELELRVELLSSTKDEAILSLDGMMQDLARENATLRRLVRDLSGLIGEGIGGFLPKLGWDIKSFDEFRDRNDTTTMNESYSHRKKHPHTPAPGIVPILAGQKRRVDDLDANEADREVRKRSKPNAKEHAPGASGQPTLFAQDDALNYGNNDQSSSSEAYSQETVLPSLPSVPRLTGSTSYADSNTRASRPRIITDFNPASGGYTSGAGASGPNEPYQFQLRPAAFTESSAPSLIHSVSPNDEARVAKREEAGKLIHYHVNSYKQNPSHILPPSLRPSHIQRTVDHEFLIDGIPFPDIRDKMILYKGSFDLVDALHILYSTCIIHTDDLTNHMNWELPEEWFTKFGYLTTRADLDSTNKWRRDRGEAEIPASMIEDDNATFGP